MAIKILMRPMLTCLCFGFSAVGGLGWAELLGWVTQGFRLPGTRRLVAEPEELWRPDLGDWERVPGLAAVPAALGSLQLLQPRDAAVAAVAAI